MSQKKFKPMLSQYLQVGKKAAEVGGTLALKYFSKQAVKVFYKKDLSPVTQADKETEYAIRKVLKQHCRQHQICGEELEDWSIQQSEFRWWIDPIDGTRLFIRGIPFWGTLLGLEYQQEVVLGVIYHPALNLMIWATKDQGCFVNGKRTRVSSIRKIEKGTLGYGSIRLFKTSIQARLVKLVSHVYDERGFGDCLAQSFVIQGNMEAVIEPVVKPYDVAAVKICVEESGGKFTDWNGKPTIYSGHALSSNGWVHQQILNGLRGSSPNA
jgi:histidinol phosphatase-like enzyme (inositol monophosphatase family)